MVKMTQIGVGVVEPGGGSNGLGPCPDDDTMIAAANGVLGPASEEAFVAHVDRCLECRKHLAALVRLNTPRTGASESGAEALPLVLREGETIGPYRLRRRLGSGGMGVVWLAHDPRLDREVAVKVLRPCHVHEALAVRRLRREAQMMARLDDEHIVQVYDVGTDGDRTYIAMRHVAGTTLGQWSAAHCRLPLHERLVPCIAAGRALARAHASGSLHRDVKPSNILVADDGRAYLADLGLACLVDAPPLKSESSTPGLPSDGSLTATGALVGTPAYCAPEVLSGAEPDALADQYSLATTIAHALEPEHRPDVDGHATARVSPRRLARVLARGRHPNRSARYPSVDAMLDALEPFARRPRRWAPWVAVGVIGLALAWLVLVDAAAPASRQREPAPDPQPAAAPPREDEHRLQALLERSDRLQSAGDLEQSRRWLDEARRIAAQSGHGGQRARVMSAMAWQLLHEGQPDAAVKSLEGGIHLAEAASAHRVAATLRLQLMELQGTVLGQPAAAREQEPFVRAELARLGGDAELEARLEIALGWLCRLLGEPACVDRQLARAVVAASRAGVSWKSDRDVALLRGDVHADRGEPKRAQLYLQRALDITRREEPTDVVRVMQLRQKLAAMIAVQGNTAEALQIASEALDEGLAALGAEHPALGGARLAMTDLLLANGEPKAAESQAREALRLAELHFSDDGVSRGRAWLMVAVTLREQERRQPAIAAFARAEVELQTSVPASDPSLVEARRALAELDEPKGVP